MGDVMDRRKYVSYKTATDFRKRFIDKFVEIGVDLHLIVGNHDTYYKNTSEVNSMEELVSNNFKVYTGPEVVEFDETPILLMPWINANNYNASMDALKNAQSDILMGHLEVAGFAMTGQGMVSADGWEKEHFKRFETVFSGHFHHKNDDGQIFYLGTPYEIYWNDCDDPKGFHIFDTETRELTFIANPSCIFHKVMYNDSVNRDAHLKDYSQYKGCYLKVIVEEKKDPYFFDRFLDKLYAAGPANITVLEDATEYDVGDDETLNLAQDTPTLVGQYIDAIETEDDKSRLKKLVHELYIEALSENLING